MGRILDSKDWINAVSRVFQVIRDQMKDTWPSIPTSLSTQPNPGRVSIENRYRFRRYTDRPTETLGESGLGGIAKECGLVKSAFRPSDDATTLPYLVNCSNRKTMNSAHAYVHRFQLMLNSLFSY